MFFFFFNDTTTTEIYTLSLHDALPISSAIGGRCEQHGRLVVAPADAEQAEAVLALVRLEVPAADEPVDPAADRSEEHTSELQSRQYLVCRLLLETKKTIQH